MENFRRVLASADANDCSYARKRNFSLRPPGAIEQREPASHIHQVFGNDSPSDQIHVLNRFFSLRHDGPPSGTLRIS